MNLLFAAPAPVLVSITNSTQMFPVNRIYCVGRNYEEHAKEMGHTGREAPFFFCKPADAIVHVAHGATGQMPYPSMTNNLHHEIELVIAIGQNGRNISAANAHRHIAGYAVGLDMTRRDLQTEMKKQGRPWEVGKAFDHSAPIGPITLSHAAPAMTQGSISLKVNDQLRQNSDVSQLIWNVTETIEQLSQLFELKAGDLIFTGTPAGVGAVVVGDHMVGAIEGLGELSVKMTTAL